MVYNQPAKKSLGQHFLSDSYYLSQLLHLIGPQQHDRFIEIGPGSGCLTDLLAAKCQWLKAIEVDTDCVLFLRDLYSGMPHVDVVESDFLQFDFDLLPLRRYRWVGNLPYNVSVPILLRLLRTSDYVEDGIFLLQKEVAERCCAQVGDKHYGRLGIVLQCVFEISSCLSIPPEAFSPPPKVDSEVIIMRPLSQPRLDYLDHPFFTEVLKRCFSQRRKMLRKIFHGKIQESAWQTMNIDSSLRPERICAGQFYQIACCLQKDSE